MKLGELLRQHEDTILRIKTRLYFLLAVENQLKDITKEKSYRIKNDIVHRLLIDTWDMLVIDLASLSKGMIGTGGFFNQLKANCGAIKPVKKKEIVHPKGNINYHNYQPSKEEIERIQIQLEKNFIQLMIQGNKETLFDLFPKAKDRTPIKIKAEDIDELKDRFSGLITDVIDDRNKNRAHRFEKIRSKNRYEKLNFEKLKNKFESIESLLNKIRLVVDQSSFSYSDMNQASSEEVAKDMVTMMLWGSNKMIDISSGINNKMNNGKEHISQKTYAWMLRNKMIEDSHSHYDSIAKGLPQKEIEKSDFCFNDVNLRKIRERG